MLSPAYFAHQDALEDRALGASGKRPLYADAGSQPPALKLGSGDPIRPAFGCGLANQPTAPDATSSTTTTTTTMTSVRREGSSPRMLAATRPSASSTTKAGTGVWT